MCTDFNICTVRDSDQMKGQAQAVQLEAISEILLNWQAFLHARPDRLMENNTPPEVAELHARGAELNAINAARCKALRGWKL